MKFNKADCIKVNFEDSDCLYAHFENANCYQAHFENTNLESSDFKDAYNLTVEQLSEAKTLYGVRNLKTEIEKELREKYPELLEEPKRK